MSAVPLSDAEFAVRMDGFAPFEARPRLAIGVSGGRDSLALTLLADRWARARGGTILALTVDHGLRPDSAAEAARVGAWLAGRGIAHRVLAWEGDKPTSGLQAAARQARRELLLAACRTGGILHLLLGHQEDDQAETLLLRLAADSGRDGLAGMSAVAETASARLLRPLLGIPRARLAATLTALGQDWVDDPSNRDARFARVAARDVTAAPADFAAAARAFGRDRRLREEALAALLARLVAIHPEGWATLDNAALIAAPGELGRRALARVLLAIGGGGYAPRAERLDRLHAALAAGRLGRGRTLGGCRIVPRRDGLLVLRETASIGPVVAVTGPGDYLWDGRFVVGIANAERSAGVTLRALGAAGWAALAAADKSLRRLPIPPAVRPTLPALWDLEGIRAVPHLLYRRRGADPDSVRVVSVAFRPPQALTSVEFAVG